MNLTTDLLKQIVTEEVEAVLSERCQKGYKTHPTRKTKEMYGKTYRNCIKAEEKKNPRIPRKPGQPADSDDHSDLYTDENEEKTIHGLGFKDEAKARASVAKIKKSNRTHAHKTQAAIAMEQRAKAAGKTKEAAIFRKFIEQQKKKTKAKNKTNEEELEEKKKRKKKSKKGSGGKRDGKGSKSKGYGLHQWFQGGGWVQVGGKYDGKPCAKQKGQKTKPYCRDPDDRDKLSKKEKEKRARKKRREDPNPNRRGKAKNVSQKSKRKKK